MNIFDYKWWWSRIGGRPWTFILRDVWHKTEIVWIWTLVSLGVYLGHHYEWKSILTGWLIFNIGYLMGHLFWSTKYIENQPGE